MSGLPDLGVESLEDKHDFTWSLNLTQNSQISGYNKTHGVIMPLSVTPTKLDTHQACKFVVFHFP